MARFRRAAPSHSSSSRAWQKTLSFPGWQSGGGWNSGRHTAGKGSGPTQHSSGKLSLSSQHPRGKGGSTRQESFEYCRRAARMPVPVRDSVLPNALAVTILLFLSFLIQLLTAAAALRPSRRLLCVREVPRSVATCKGEPCSVPGMPYRRA